MAGKFEWRLSEPERRFCEIYRAGGDIGAAVREAELEVPVTRSSEGYGKSLLDRQDIRDYLCVLGGDTNEIEALIDRLSAMRRESWRRGDVRGSKEIDMDVAKLRGWLIERVESRVTNVAGKAAGELTNEELLARLTAAVEKKMLPAGVKLLPDGTLDIVEGEYVEVKGAGTV